MIRTTRSRTILASLAAALVLTACAGDTADEVAGPTQGTVVTTAQGAPGTFLTDDTGMSLYLFTNDTPGVSNCTGDCLAAWPALLTDGTPVARGGVDATLLGTTTRDDGSIQVTYRDQPLYFFAGDVAPGDLTGQGVNDAWFVVAPSGAMLTTEGGEDAAGTGSTMGGSTGGGYGSGGGGEPPAMEYDY